MKFIKCFSYSVGWGHIDDSQTLCCKKSLKLKKNLEQNEDSSLKPQLNLCMIAKATEYFW